MAGISRGLSDVLPYTDRGRGTTLVLLHGFPLDRRMWDAQVERLSQSCRVMAPDFRGFGRSGNRDPFTIESLADDIHVFVQQLAAKPCVLAGLSMGGYVALAFAKKYPDALRGLVLLDTKAGADDAKGREGRGKMIELARSEGATAVADQMLPKVLAPDTVRDRPDLVKATRAMMANCSPQTIEYALAAMRDRPDRTGELASIQAPTLVVVGGADAVTPPDVAEAMAKAIPGAKLEVIRGAGHLSPMEQPDQVNGAIERFMASL